MYTFKISYAKNASFIENFFRNLASRENKSQQKQN